MTAVMGIDPGKNGGISVIDLLHDEVRIHEMPETFPDIHALVDSEFQHVDGDIVACLERVHAMPKQGVSSTFKFGWHYGGLMMALTAFGIAYTNPTPQKWVRSLALPPRKKTETANAWKKRLREEAQRRFPDYNISLKAADSLLIADYGVREDWRGKIR